MVLHRRRRRSELSRASDGAVAVEFALVLPVLMLLVFGAIQWGMVMAQNAALAGGARAGARYGVVNIISAHTCQGVVTQVRQAASTIAMSGTKVAVTVKVGQSAAAAVTVCASAADSSTVSNPTTQPCAFLGVTPSDSNRLYVTAQYTSPSLLPIPLGPFNLVGQGTYRCEYKH